MDCNAIRKVINTDTTRVSFYGLRSLVRAVFNWDRPQIKEKARDSKIVSSVIRYYILTHLSRPSTKENETLLNIPNQVS